MNIQNDTYYQIVNSMTFPLVIINLQKKITIINISGEDFFKTSSKMVVGKDIRDFMPFSSPIINLIDISDLCIMRAGATSLAEISFLNKPFIAIPLPTSKDNHQMKNCIYLEENDSIILIDQKNLSEANLANIILKLIDNQDLLKTLSENLLKLNKKNATKEICNHVKNVLGIYNEK